MRIELICVILLIGCAAFAADKCPSAPKVRIKKTAVEPTIPKPTDGKALFVVVRGNGDYLIAPVSANGKWIGANAGWTFFYAEVDPGDYVLCTGARYMNAATRAGAPLTVRAESGRTYWLEQTRPRDRSDIQVDEVTEQQAMSIIRRSKLSAITKLND